MGAVLAMSGRANASDKHQGRCRGRALQRRVDQAQVCQDMMARAGPFHVRGWALDGRNAALELVANAPQKLERGAHATPRRFEPATAALPPITLRPPRFDRMIVVAAVGWGLIACALTGHVHGLY